jgi:CRP-like cAMP-binding protein
LDDLADRLAGLTLFADLSNPQLSRLAHDFEEQLFPEGRRILRQGLTGSGLYVITDGEASVLIDGEERAHLGRGDFFGEVSILLREAPTADVVATTPLRCLVIPEPQVRGFLVSNPEVMLRMLQAVARRLANTLRWLA